MLAYLFPATNAKIKSACSLIRLLVTAHLPCVRSCLQSCGKDVLMWVSSSVGELGFLRHCRGKVETGIWEWEFDGMERMSTKTRETKARGIKTKVHIIRIPIHNKKSVPLCCQSARLGFPIATENDDWSATLLHKPPNQSQARVPLTLAQNVHDHRWRGV
jgi:hypothetical protein